MGKYTVPDYPFIDQMIDDHLRQIVSAITARISPLSIILYGSLARGEASVIVKDGQVLILSDYEIRVIDQSLRVRHICKDLSQELSSELGIEINIAWMHPQNLLTNQVGYHPFKGKSPSIFWYEFISSGKTLFGKDLLSEIPSINPDDIPLRSGIILLLNRMAESLEYLPRSSSVKHTPTEITVWINKTILACVEALLLTEKCYHYSYKERGHRFDLIVYDAFASLIAKSPKLPDLAKRATEFKLSPNLNLYSDDLEDAWAEVANIIDLVFRYLVKQEYGISFESYAEFPNEYLTSMHKLSHKQTSGLTRITSSITQKLIDTIKYIEHKRWPTPIFVTKYSPFQIVYALVPLLFQSYFYKEQKTSLQKVREWLRWLERLETSSPNHLSEWNYLQQKLIWNWKVFCY